MIIEKIISSLFPVKQEPIQKEAAFTAAVRQVNYHASGKEIFLRERSAAIDRLYSDARSIKEHVLHCFVFEQSSYGETWSIHYCGSGTFFLLSDRGRSINGTLDISTRFGTGEELEKFTDLLLRETTRTDAFPAPGFGHASFYFFYGRSVYFTKKHLPLLERLDTRFRELYFLAHHMKSAVERSM